MIVTDGYQWEILMKNTNDGYQLGLPMVVINDG